jgi:serine/threonine protein kinase
MTAERWAQVKTLFTEALEHPRGERAALLEQRCGADRDLLDEVRSLLDSHDAAEERDQSERATESMQPDAAAISARGFEGRQIGSYTLLREIGRGGMAVVYLAERSDEQFRKRVAVKVVNVLGSVEMVRRFRNERQTLAALDHPNIVKLLDGGTAEGLPYLVMDYVEGAPIDDYADSRRLTINQRLTLFLTICGAVQYAHRNLVVHRDLKPENILVTNDGTVKLLDFGIAKLLNQELQSETVVTRAAARPMTPEYASPEQVRGEHVTVAADVYSLGVILYDLLTERVVCTEDPRPPSAAAASASAEICTARGEPNAERLSRRLAGDLDNIVLMALRKEPQRRYTSVDHFAEDIRRFLANLPVTARKATFSYRARKFVRRHAAAVAVASAVSASLLGAAAFSTYEARVASRERAIAERRFNDLHQLADSFLFEFDRAIRALPGSTPARKLIVEKALEYLNRLSAEAGADASLERDLARAYLRVGDIQGNPVGPNLGDLRGWLESAERGRRISERLLKLQPNNPENIRILADADYDIAQAQLFSGKPKDAVANLNQAIALLEPLAVRNPANLDVQLALSARYETLGDAYGHPSVANLGQPGKALEDYRKALAVLENARATHSGDMEPLRRMAIEESKIGDILGFRHDLDGAIEQHRKALDVFETVAKAEPDSAQAQRELRYEYQRLGAYLWDSGKRAEGLDLLGKSLTISEKLSAADPANVQFKDDLAVSLGSLGEAKAESGNTAGAIADVRRAIEMAEENVAGDPVNRQRKAQLAAGLSRFANLLEAAGQKDEARRARQRAQALRRELAH